MTAKFFKKVLPAHDGLASDGCRGPGFEVNVVSQGGRIRLSLTPLDAAGCDRAQVFMTPEQGHELLLGLLEAIDRAETEHFRRPN